MKKSSLSRSFVQATHKQVLKFQEHRFHETTFCAVFIDGIASSDAMMVAALGVDKDGAKYVTG